MEKSVRIIAKTVSMYTNEWAVVELVMKQNGLRKCSAALRHIINDYHARHNLPSPHSQNQVQK